MAYLYGKRWTRKQLTERIGDVSQIAVARPFQFADGRAKGLDGIEFGTGSGFRFTVLPGRGMDIGTADFQGKSLCWRSAAGAVAAEFYQPEGLGWLWSFGGGLLTTCGLSHVGAPCVDEGEALGLHGRVSNTPASEVSVQCGWEEDEYIVGVTGKVTEARVFGINLVLTRSIFAFLGQSRLYVHDEVVNEGHEPAPHMMLYHFNFGFPVVEAGARLAAPSLSVAPRDADADDGKKEYAIFHAPRAGYKEKVYYHDLAEAGGKTLAGIVNPNIGFGAYVKYDRVQLPWLVQWKMMARGHYVVGVEPATNKVEGRDKERREGRLRMLKPGETAVYDLEIGALTDKQECAEFEKAVSKVRGRRKTKIGNVGD